jgi:hypothetical protein
MDRYINNITLSTSSILHVHDNVITLANYQVGQLYFKVDILLVTVSHVHKYISF